MRILIVEDDALAAMHMRAVLEDAGHRVVGMWPDVVSALAAAPTLNFDLALVDYYLDRNSFGGEAVKLLWERHQRPSIFVSGNTQVCRMVRREDGALGCLAKPFTDASLLRAVAIAEDLIAGKQVRSPLGKFEIYPTADSEH